MATAEFAVALPAVVLVLTLIVALAQALVLQHRMTHAASVGARVAARGESVSAVEAAARSAGGAQQGRVVVSRDGAFVTVRVAASTPALISWAVPEVSSAVEAWREPADAADTGTSGTGTDTAAEARGVARGTASR